jgi:hypothetical protein
MRDDSGPAPTFTVVVPVWNTEPSLLHAMYASLLAQRYATWDLSIVDDASTRAETRAALDQMATDARVHIDRLDTNTGIVHATQRALSHARGDWIAFVDHDDVLHEDALLDVARLIRAVPDLEMVYTDQDLLRGDGSIGDPAFKSAWSPDLLRATNCVMHLSCYRRSRLETLGGMRDGYDGGQDYDLLLRVADSVATTRIGHVARPRYHWRAAVGSVAADVDAKPWAFEAAERALADSLRRRNMGGRVEPHEVRGWYHTRYDIARDVRATVVFIGEEGSALATTRDAIANAAPGAVAVEHVEHASTVAAATSLAANAHTDLVMFVGAGVVPAPGALDALAEHATRPEVGFTGGVCTDDAGGRSFGLVIGGDETVRRATPDIDPGNFAWSGRVVRNLSAVPLHLAATRPDVLRTTTWDDGLDGDLFAADVCLRARRRGLFVVSTPHAGASTIRTLPAVRTSARMTRSFRERWQVDDVADPYVNPNVRGKVRDGGGLLAKLSARARRVLPG